MSQSNIEFTPEEIQSNWETHLKIINKFISSPRKEKILSMYEELEEQIVLAPASGKSHYHNAIPGGYIDHVNNVVKCSLQVLDTWKTMGANIDFTQEELIFTAIVHDLGKIGEPGKDFYIPQTNKWRVDNLNENYTYNKELDFMLIIDRTFFMLQKYNIELSVKEYLTIRVHDGLYEDINKPYFISSNVDAKLRSNLPYVLNQGDFLASTLEYERWKFRTK